jgi:hypothetical protein
MSRATSPVPFRPGRVSPHHGMGIRGMHAMRVWSRGVGGGAHEIGGLLSRDGSQARFERGTTLAACWARQVGPRGPGRKDEYQERWP